MLHACRLESFLYKNLFFQGCIISYHILSLILIVGYGVQAGPNNGQQIKGTIQRYTEDAQTPRLSHTHKHTPRMSFD